ELTFIGRLLRNRWRFFACRLGIVRAFSRQSSWNWRFNEGLSSADFLRFGTSAGAKNGRQKNAGASPGKNHFAVANATFVTPASLQVLSTFTTFLYAPASSPRITTAWSG